ncbi:DUF5678 domain-containing protein [Nanoarchaeota archaeon]
MDNHKFYLKANLDPYIGEWIAICDEQIAAHGKSVKKVISDAKRKFPKKKPLLARIPNEETMIF